MSASAVGRRVRGALVELPVVVIGVLIALAAESAWQARVEIADEQRYLSALAVDLSDARQVIERTLAATERQRADVDAVRDFLRGTGGPDPELADAVIAWPRVATVPLTTIETLVATGDIRLLDTVLRREIVKRRSELAAIDNTLQRLFDLASANIREWVFASARLEVATGSRVDGPLAGRGDSDVLAIYDLHAGLLNDLAVALADMHDAVVALDTVIP